MYADAGYAYLGDHDGFIVADVSDSTNPYELGRRDVDGWQYDPFVFRHHTYAYVASHWAGLCVFDIHDLANPELDSQWYSADGSVDVYVDDNLLYVANTKSGLQIVDVSAPSLPRTLATFDTVGQSPQTQSVVARDSFAFMGWRLPRLLSVDVTDPTCPLRTGGAEFTNAPQDLVLTDTICYVAAGRRFYVVNVARPREPELVGSCVIADGVYYGLAVQDSFAYVATSDFVVINIARPDSPVVIATLDYPAASGVAVRDTFAYIPYVRDTLWVYSISDPAHPRPLSATPTGVWPWDVALSESKAFVATSDGYGVDVFDLSDPGRPVRVGRATAPADIRRLHYSNGYLYAAMWGAGVAVYETTATGVGEQAGPSRPASPVRLLGSVVRDVAVIEGHVNRGMELKVSIYDVAGRLRKHLPTVVAQKQGLQRYTVNVASLGAGVYVIKVAIGDKDYSLRVVKTQGR